MEPQVTPISAPRLLPPSTAAPPPTAPRLARSLPNQLNNPRERDKLPHEAPSLLGVSTPKTRDDLPGGTVLDSIALDRAVAHINGIYTQKGLKTATKIGSYVLDMFFAGDFESFRHEGKKHVTFRALAERDDLCVSHSFIWYAVAVLEQSTQLPDDVSETLPFSHHKLLLPIKDLELKLELAREAVARRMSKRKLAERIRGLRRNSAAFSRAGRPPLPSFVKGLTQVRRGVELACSEELSDDLFDRYGLDDAGRLLDETTQQIETLERLVTRLRAQVSRLRERA